MNSTGLLVFPAQDPGNKEAGQNKEYIDANETTAKARNMRMVQYDQENGNGAQALNVGPMFEAIMRFRIQAAWFHFLITSEIYGYLTLIERLLAGLKVFINMGEVLCRLSRLEKVKRTSV